MNNFQSRLTAALSWHEKTARPFADHVRRSATGARLRKLPCEALVLQRRKCRAAVQSSATAVVQGAVGPLTDAAAVRAAGADAAANLIKFRTIEFVLCGKLVHGFASFRGL
jgi:hypothetical protein